MSKKRTPNSHPNGALKADSLGAVRRDTFTTQRGMTVEISGVSPFLVQRLDSSLRAQWEAEERPLPDPPTYETVLPGGETERHAHDEASLRTDEDRAAWARYLAAAEAYNTELRDRTMRLLFLRGVVTLPPEDEAWIEEQRFIGIAVPASALERRVHWVQTEVVSSPGEAIRLMNAILELSGVDKEALREAEDSFRGAMEAPGRDPAARSAVEAGGVVPQPALPGSEDGQGVGPEAQ